VHTSTLLRECSQSKIRFLFEANEKGTLRVSGGRKADGS